MWSNLFTELEQNIWFLIKKQKVECYQIIIWFVKCDVFDQFDKEKWQGTVNPWNNI